jgi:ribose transport system substrate-binding protein
MSISGLGPHGERAAPADKIVLSEAEQTAASKRRFAVAVVLHTTTSDWSKQELAGIVTMLGRFGAAVVEVIDCGFDVDTQNDALRRLAKQKLDAVISIPIGNAKVADTHRALAATGTKLVLLDNGPTGLIPGTDYVSVVSGDNFGLGQIAAELLSPWIEKNGEIGILSYAADFFATHEREIAFRKWMSDRRPDISIVRGKFQEPSHAAQVASALLDEHPALAGLFAVWDVPATIAASELRARGAKLAITTVDLGNEAAADLTNNGLIKGVAAQQPYDQGLAVATITLQALLGKSIPPWIALPGLAVTGDNVVEAYQVVWHAPAPPAVARLRLAAVRDQSR